MRVAHLALPCLAWGVLWAPLASGADRKDATDAVQQGGALYRTHCATCHGPAGKGDGPKTEGLRVAPPDLTELSHRNGGKYPFERVYRIIDGRDLVKGHGGNGMPVWGDVFLDAREGYSSEKVKEKITELTRYLASIQTAEPSAPK